MAFEDHNDLDNAVWGNADDATVEVWEWIIISSHTLPDMWLLIHAGIKIDPC